MTNLTKQNRFCLGLISFYAQTLTLETLLVCHTDETCSKVYLLGRLFSVVSCKNESRNAKQNFRNVVSSYGFESKPTSVSIGGGED